MNKKYLRPGDVIDTGLWGQFTLLQDDFKKGKCYHTLMDLDGMPPDPKFTSWFLVQQASVVTEFCQLRVGDKVQDAIYGHIGLVAYCDDTMVAIDTGNILYDLKPQCWTLLERVENTGGEPALATWLSYEVKVPPKPIHTVRSSWNPSYSSDRDTCFKAACEEGRRWVQRNMREWPYGKKLRFEGRTGPTEQLNRKGKDGHPTFYSPELVDIFWEDEVDNDF